MRWLVEVSSLGKTDLQKFCVEAESWQRALQAARSQRGEEGPMSGFSIELLEEGYRAVDPMARVRFVVRKAPDDMPVTAAPPKELKGGTAPSAAARPPASDKEAGGAKAAEPAAPSNNDATTPALPPTPSSSSPSKKGPPRPAQSLSPTATGAAALASVPVDGKKGKTMTFSSGATADSEKAGKTDAERPPLPAIGSTVPGQPATKLLTSREQNPSDSSPLTYREYAFAVPAGTTEEVASEVLRAQLRYVEAHIATSKVGKLVNLAVFDVEFTGKPPKPPIATLTWKDWKGEPVISYPHRGGASSAPRPPSKMPPSAAPAANAAAAPAAVPGAAATPQIPSGTQPPPQPQPQPQVQVQTQPPVQAQTQTKSQPPPAPPAQQAPQRIGSQPVFPAAVNAPAIVEVEPRRSPSQPPGAPNMVKTPSGRFVRGRISGDELITSLFESMHDLHFLRDALDGGQFCLALATEVLPARAALIHFFDIEKREWVVACTRGKETQRMLTMRHVESDNILRTAARKRRAVVVADASQEVSDRYRQLGGARSLIAAPIMQAGRALGALEIINPLDGMPFTDDEGNAMTYIAEQYAEYLGSRGIVLDRERISAAAAR